MIGLWSSRCVASRKWLALFQLRWLVFVHSMEFWVCLCLGKVYGALAASGVEFVVRYYTCTRRCDLDCVYAIEHRWCFVNHS